MLAEIRKAIHENLKLFHIEKQYIVEGHEEFDWRAVGPISFDPYQGMKMKLLKILR